MKGKRLSELSLIEQKRVIFRLILFRRRKCLYCSKKFLDGILNENANFSGEYLFHVYQTHGVSPELYVNLMNGNMNKFAQWAIEYDKKL